MKLSDINIQDKNLYVQICAFETTIYKFNKIIEKEKRLNTQLETLAKKIEEWLSTFKSLGQKVSQEFDSLNKSPLLLGFTTQVISLVNTEAEELESELNATKSKLKKLLNHPFYPTNQQKFLGKLEVSFKNYLETKKNTMSNNLIYPYEACFSRAKYGLNLAAIIEIIKDVDYLNTQSKLEEELSSYHYSNDTQKYTETHSRLCQDYADMIVRLYVNDQNFEFPVNRVAFDINGLWDDLDESKEYSIKLSLSEKCPEPHIELCAKRVQEFLTSGDIQNIDESFITALSLLMQVNQDSVNVQQQNLVISIIYRLENQYISSILEKKLSKIQIFAELFESFSDFYYKPTFRLSKNCLLLKTEGDWINMKLNLLLQIDHYSEEKKEIEIKKVLSEYNEIFSNKEIFNKEFPEITKTGFMNYPWLYRALNIYQWDIQVQFIVNSEKFKEKSYHHFALKQHLPFISKETPKDSLSISLPLKDKAALEKICAYLDCPVYEAFNATELSNAEALSLYNLCKSWEIKGMDEKIFSHFTDEDFANDEMYLSSKESNDQFLLGKIIRALLNKAMQSDEAYTHVDGLLLDNPCTINKLDLSNLKFSKNKNSDPLLALLKPLRKELKELNLRGSEVTDDELSTVKNLVNLTYLDLQFCSLITENVLRPIEKLKKLTYLNLDFCEKLPSTTTDKLRINLN